MCGCVDVCECIMLYRYVHIGWGKGVYGDSFTVSIGYMVCILVYLCVLRVGIDTYA